MKKTMHGPDGLTVELDTDKVYRDETNHDAAMVEDKTDILSVTFMPLIGER